jgi:hypothetical protein
MNQAASVGGQFMADQTPRFEGSFRKKKPRRENQVVSKTTGIIRPDKRQKHKYL